jgi:glycerol-3-phosphate O-acyltransferase
MKCLLENEMNLEFFIEAGRSRTGQVLHPKFGMLKYIIEAYLEKRIPDATIIPLNITYENLIESDSYIVEHRGGSKVKEDTLRVIKALGIMTKKFGKIIINSSEPINLRQYIEKNLNKDEMTQANALNDEFIQEMGYQITYTLQDLSVFMGTHLLCSVLLMRQHYQLIKEVEISVKVLVQEIKKREGNLFKLESNEFNFDEAIKCFQSRVSVTGDTLNERRVCINRTNYIDNCLAIKYYSNSINYLFYLEAIIYYSAYNQIALHKVISFDLLWKKVSILQKMTKKVMLLRKWIESKEEMIAFIEFNK